MPIILVTISPQEGCATPRSHTLEEAYLFGVKELF